MGKLTCPKCQQDTSHIILEYCAQNTQSKHGEKIMKNGIGRLGEWVKCTVCLLTYLSVERNTNNGTKIVQSE